MRYGENDTSHKHPGCRTLIKALNSVAVAILATITFSSCALYTQTNAVTVTGVWISEPIPVETLRFLFIQAFGDYTTTNTTSYYSTATYGDDPSTSDVETTYGLSGNALTYQNYFQSITSGNVYIRLTLDEENKTSTIELLDGNKQQIYPAGSPTYLESPFFAWSGSFLRAGPVITNATVSGSNMMTKYKTASGWESYPYDASSSLTDTNFALAVTGGISMDTNKTWLALDASIVFPLTSNIRTLRLATPESLLSSANYKPIVYHPQ